MGVLNTYENLGLSYSGEKCKGAILLTLPMRVGLGPQMSYYSLTLIMSTNEANVVPGFLWEGICTLSKRNDLQN